MAITRTMERITDNQIGHMTISNNDQTGAWDLVDYNSISNKLTFIHEKLIENPNSDISKRLILSSYLFARLSIQTYVNIHENEYKLVMKYLDSVNFNIIDSDILEMLINSNYRFTKIKDIIKTFKNIKEYDFNVLTGNNIKEILNVLRNDNVFVGLGFIKISFTLEMLGFNVGCLDTHIFQLLKKTNKIVNKYSKIKRNGKRFKIYTNAKSIGQDLNVYMDNLNKLKEFPEYGKFNNLALTQWYLWNKKMQTNYDHNVYFELVNKTILEGN